MFVVCSAGLAHILQHHIPGLIVLQPKSDQIQSYISYVPVRIPHWRRFLRVALRKFAGVDVVEIGRHVVWIPSSSWMVRV
jgi:hypothetical protein